MNRRLRPFYAWFALGVVVILVICLVAVFTLGGGGTKTISAEFAEAPGLYVGNHVDVLGIPVGTITSIKPEADFVLVKMSVRKSLKIPANANAVLMAPEVVADRFVELEPTYTGGAVMPAGADIPLVRTTIPQSVDAVIGTLNTLADQLGPNGANKNGALTNLVHQLATSFGGTGQDFHNAVVNFSQALSGLSANSPALAGTLTNLGQLSQALSDNSNTYTAFASSLASVSQTLAADRTDVQGVLSSLQGLFADLTTFIDDNGKNLGASIQNLDQLASTLQTQQAALAQVYDLSPLSLENLDNAIDKTAPGGPSLVGRYNGVGSTQGLFNQVCGSTALRFLVILATGTQTNPLTKATPVDTLCGIGNALNALTPPPGSASGPDLSLQALAGS